MTNTIYYIAKRRELRDAAPERCYLTLSVLCLIFHLSMKVKDNAEMFKPKFIINFSCRLGGNLCS